MVLAKKVLKTCEKGHEFYKSAGCPTCPECEAERRPESGFLSRVAAPARRALEREGITTLRALSQYTEVDLLKLHGLGPSTIPKLKKALTEARLSFKSAVVE